MEFEVQTSGTTIDDFAAYWLAFRWKPPGKKPPKQASPRARRLAGFVVLLGGAAIFALNLWLDALSTPYTSFMGILFFAVGLFAVIQGVPEHPYWVRTAWKKYQKRGDVFTYRFTPKSFEVHAKTSDHRYDYTLLQELWEDEGHFYLLFQSQHTPFMLNKTGFTQGDPTAFAPFLEEKTGKPIRWVNGERKKLHYNKENLP